MKDFYYIINRASITQRWMLGMTLSLLLIFIASVVFPLKYEFSLYIIVMTATYFLAGAGLYAVWNLNFVFTMVIIIILSIIGLGISFMVGFHDILDLMNLTVRQVLLTYGPLLIASIFGYEYLKKQVG